MNRPPFQTLDSLDVFEVGWGSWTEGTCHLLSRQYVACLHHRLCSPNVDNKGKCMLSSEFYTAVYLTKPDIKVLLPCSVFEATLLNFCFTGPRPIKKLRLEIDFQDISTAATVEIAAFFRDLYQEVTSYSGCKLLQDLRMLRKLRSHKGRVILFTCFNVSCISASSFFCVCLHFST